jgi:hypothetical protein
VRTLEHENSHMLHDKVDKMVYRKREQSLGSFHPCHEHSFLEKSVIACTAAMRIERHTVTELQTDTTRLW